MKSKVNNRRKKTEKKYVYIVLTQTKTYAARIIRLYTREPYAHASIAFDEDLEEMYSFARKERWNPFNAGFVRERTDKGVFGACEETECSIYQLKVTEAQLVHLHKEIELFKENAEQYSYNFLGILGVVLHKPIARKNRYFCSQFVAHLMEKSEIGLFQKNSALVRPVDIRVCKKLKLVYRGKLVEYKERRYPEVLSQ